MSITHAGSAIVVRMNPSGTSVNTRTRGKRTRYAPITPLIAPDAPTIGIAEPGSATHLQQRRRQAAQQVEGDESRRVIESSMLLPKSQRNHMLPSRCIHEPCRNIEVRTLMRLTAGIGQADEPVAHREPCARRQRAGQLAGDETEVADRRRERQRRPAPWTRSRPAR